jgi:hypothetical protein
MKFSALKGRVIHGIQLWTATDGLNALMICIEAWFPFFPNSCFPASEYANSFFLAYDVGIHLEHVSSAGAYG